MCETVVRSELVWGASVAETQRGKLKGKERRMGRKGRNNGTVSVRARTHTNTHAECDTMTFAVRRWWCVTGWWPTMMAFRRVTGWNYHWEPAVLNLYHTPLTLCLFHMARRHRSSLRGGRSLALRLSTPTGPSSSFLHLSPVSHLPLAPHLPPPTASSSTTQPPLPLSVRPFRSAPVLDYFPDDPIYFWSGLIAKVAKWSFLLILIVCAHLPNKRWA